MISIFRTKRNADIENFARTLAEDLAKRYPPELDKNPNQNSPVSRLTRILEDTCQKACDFQKSKNLGLYGKAKFGNTFKWALKELGYREKFIDVATEAVIVHISNTRQR